MEKLPINPILIWIKNRISANKNVIISINGPTGSAKTYSAITLAKQVADMLGTNFTINENLDFNFSKLLKKTMLPKNTKPGTPFIFEEVGAFGSGSSSREWQSKANKFFFSFMQTSRHRQQILFFTCPHFSFLEKGTRSLVHLQCETDGIDHIKRLAFLRCYKIQVNSRTGQFYFKYFRVNYKGKRFKFKRLELQHPPDDMAKEYEVVKNKFTTQLNNTIIEDDKPRRKEIDYKKMDGMIKEGQTGRLIARECHCGLVTVNRRKRYHKDVINEQNPNNILIMP